jgi:uncharacterized membrane protein YphA (DoxX/SURF4 family)
VSIYVEIHIRGTLDELWRRTQQPDLHRLWDLRFSEIDYLPRSGANAPQRFRYTTRIGLGLRIAGEGESTGTRDGPAGERTSALRFWSMDPKSLILEGAGYWRYVPSGDGVRFLTWYSYRPRFGLPGRVLDAALFRPLMGWATAWSFDRLRLWIEKGIDPTLSMQRSVVHTAARFAIAIVLMYQGVVPKLLHRHPSELAMLSDAGFGPGSADWALTLIGLAEIVFGAFLLAAWHTRWPFVAVLALMIAALIGVAAVSPRELTAAFNPVALNVSMSGLAVIGWLTNADRPSAGRCLRVRPVEAP